MGGGGGGAFWDPHDSFDIDFAHLPIRHVSCLLYSDVIIVQRCASQFIYAT